MSPEPPDCAKRVFTVYFWYNFVFLPGYSGATQRSRGRIRFSGSIICFCAAYVRSLCCMPEQIEHWLELPGRGHPVPVANHDCAKNSLYYKLFKTWMQVPISRAHRHPTSHSAKKVLSNFSGNPPWNEAEGKHVIDCHISPPFGATKEPTYNEFAVALRRPLGKGVATDGVPTGVWQMLPYNVLWVLWLWV
jgi:hypothetical protein